MKRVLLCLLAVCLAGCQKKVTSAGDNTKTAQSTALSDYMASVKGQSDAIKASLEKDALTQTDMNLKSQELRDLWDAALNRMLEESKKALSKAEADKLTADQNAWAEATAKAAENAGNEVAGGSLQALTVNSEVAKLTEARVYELYGRLK